MQYELIATSTFGIEGVLAEELDNNGFKRIRNENGRVVFGAEDDNLTETIARANMVLRTADRILVHVASFEAHTFDQLFDGVAAIPWESWICQDARFPVEGRSQKSDLFSISDCQAITKKAIATRLSKAYHIDWLPESGPLVKVEVAVTKNVVTLTLDTSGEGLHKRGYRPEVSQAPIRETLAAAIIMCSKWNPKRPFMDPCCGSGTFPIEAAMIAANIAPGINRSFIAEQWPCLDSSVWQRVRQELKDAVIEPEDLHIIGTDIDDSVVRRARNNAARAGVGQYIHFQRSDLRDAKSRFSYGTMICNPPYGERIGEQRDAELLYKRLGKVFAAEFGTWSCHVITPCSTFEKLFGRQADKKRKLFNGRIRCDLYQFFGPKLRRPATAVKPEKPQDGNDVEKV